jgi:hypothetical protein
MSVNSPNYPLTGSPLNSLMQMVHELKKCEQAGAWHACILQIFAYIDALAFLNMPSGQNTATRQDYFNWVDCYLKAHPEQTYRYSGPDVYGARCATLHKFSSEGDFHQRNPDAKIFGYHDGGRHMLDSAINPRLVLIGLASFIDDFIQAVVGMLKAMQLRIADESERKVIERRLANVLQIMPLSVQQIETKPYMFQYGVKYPDP